MRQAGRPGIKVGGTHLQAPTLHLCELEREPWVPHSSPGPGDSPSGSVKTGEGVFPREAGAHPVPFTCSDHRANAQRAPSRTRNVLAAGVRCGGQCDPRRAAVGGDQPMTVCPPGRQAHGFPASVSPSVTWGGRIWSTPGLPAQCDALWSGTVTKRGPPRSGRSLPSSRAAPLTAPPGEAGEASWMFAWLFDNQPGAPLL